MLVLLTTLTSFAQKKKTFYDSLGNETTFEPYWSQVVGGRYKSVSNNKVYTLVRTTEKEFKEEVSKTENRIIKKDRIGIDFKEFKAIDLKGDSIDKNDFKGKINVINVWFIGCSPCEMERPELNGLVDLYKGNNNVVFISFARNDANELPPFLANHPVLYKIIPTQKSEIIRIFGADVYPANIIVDKDGKYFFNSSGTGIGVSYILKREIDRALANIQ